MPDAEKEPCAYVLSPRGSGPTMNSYCTTHQMWRDADADAFGLNPEHEALTNPPGSVAP